MLRVRLLGQLRVEVDGEEVPLPRGARARGLLAWLALNPGLHARSRVAGRFWPDVLEESARGSLRRTLSDLRRALGPDGARYLAAERDRIGIPDGEAVWVDARAFEELVASRRYEEAIKLCEGELLADIGDDWALEARHEHAERLGELLGQLADKARADGRIADLVAFARRRAALDPLSEEAGRALIAALATAGDRSGAITVFERLRERLASELRLAPSAETMALIEELRRGNVPSSIAAEPAPPLPRKSLPRSLQRSRAGGFVGREPHLAQLRKVLERARAGERPIVVIAGEAGIGKTRLVAEFCSEAHTDGAAVLYGRCYEDSAPYEPFVEALRGYAAGRGAAELRRRAGPGADELARLVPELGPPEAGPATAVSAPDAARYRLFDAIDSLLGGAGGAEPPILALDDLQWADPATLMLLRHLARSPTEAPLLVLLTYRLGEGVSSAASAALLPELRGELLERTTLEGLAEDEVRLIAADRTGTEASVELGGALWGRTEGNPFFVEELLRRLAEAGVGDPATAATAVAEVALPEGVREVLERRVRRLEEPARRALATASVVGREFSLDLLETVAYGGEGLLDALDAALEAELIREVPGVIGGYSFTHALVNETLYEGLSAARRTRLHAAVAGALEQIHGDGAVEHATEIAHHLFAAGPGGGEPERAARYGALAGDLALERLAYEDAARQYQRAVDALGRTEVVDRRRRASLLLSLGEAQLRAGQAVRARTTFADAAGEARAIGAPDLLARAALGFGGLGVAIIAVDDPTVALLEEALAALGAEDSPLRSRVMARLAVELYYGPSRKRSEALSAEALEAARGLGDERALTYALNARHVALWRPDRLDERLAIAREMVAGADRTGNREDGLQARNWLVTDLFEAGEMEEVDGVISEYERLVADGRLPTFAWYVPLWRAAIATLEGRFAEAQRLAGESRELGRRAGDAHADLLAQMVDHGELIERCRIDLLVERYQELLTEKVLESPAAPAYAAGWSWFYAETGDAAAARDYFERVARDDFAHLPFDVNWLDALATCAETCWWLGEAGRAASVYRLLLPFADRHACAAGRALVSWGSLQRPLGVLCVTMGRLDEAAERFEAALAANHALGWRPWVAWTQYQYARMLLGRQARGDFERAAELLRAAAALAGELGLDGLERRIAGVDLRPAPA
jgi:DNA-binding SARP family transcriptional activator/tetratricopeptide (TPR) repeat protein